MSPIRPRLLAVAALLSLIPAVAVAEVYKWVDEDGVTHYSQQPPPEGTPTVITPTADAPSSAEDETDPDAEGRDGSADNQEDGDGEQETIADFCKGLREKEKVLQGDRPIRIKAEDGTLTDLDDEGRARRLERIQRQLRDHCQGLEAASG